MNQLQSAVSIFEKLQNAATEHDLAQCGTLFAAGGYSLFSDFLYRLQERMKTGEDTDMEDLFAMLEKGRAALPNPGAISPVWDGLWDNLEEIARQKADIFNSVPTEKRSGEWQIILDNPFSLESVTCHPGLHFAEAAYFFGFFLTDLKKNEYIRLQRVENYRLVHGRDRK